MKAFPFFPILGLIFITLKLTGYIAWGWLWILAPFWGGFLVCFLVVLAYVLWFTEPQRRR